MPSLVTREVRGTFLATDGSRLRGRVVFTPAVTVYDLAGNVVLMKRPIEANANADGLVSVLLPITNDARHTPTGWYYLVSEQFEGGPSREAYWLEVPSGSGAIELADAITDQVPPKPNYALIPGPQGDAGTIAVGAVSVLNPNLNPTVANSGTVNDAVLDFGLPRARALNLGPTTVVNNNVAPSVAASELGTGDRRFDFSLPQAKTLSLGTVTQVNPDQSPAVSDSGTVNAATFNFSLPRAAAVTVGTVTTVGPAVPADVTDSGSDGDVVLDFDIPQGIKGDTGAGVPDPIGTVGQVVASDGTDTQWVSLDTDDVAEAGNLYYTDLRVETVISGSDTDDLAEGATNLYYTDARVDLVIAASSVDDLSDVDTGTPSDGDILRFNSTSGDWESQALPQGVSLGLVMALGG